MSRSPASTENFKHVILFNCYLPDEEIQAFILIVVLIIDIVKHNVNLSTKSSARENRHSDR